MKYKPIPISVAKTLAETYDKQQVIVVAWDAAHGKTHVTTYGDTAEACRVLTFRGPWSKTWREHDPRTGANITLTHGRKVIS